jgi:hypothetical protein
MPHKDPEVRKTHLKNWRKKNREYVLEFDRNRWKNNPDRRKAHRESYVSLSQMQYARLRNYGMSQEEYDRRVAEQNNSCALCGRSEIRIHYRTQKVQSLSVDHNHTTGENRSLLCGDCNRGLGLFRDDPELLIRAAVYLNRHKGMHNGSDTERTAKDFRA